MKNRLEELAKFLETDKLGHGYMPYYEEFLPKRPSSLLEIGCYKGASLKMWDTFYFGECDIHTIDLFGEEGLMSIAKCRRLGFVPHVGNQSDMNFLAGIKEQFDVIIDDGSHNSHDQIFSFKHLFTNNLKSRGLYVIEDLHCCKQSFYWTHDVHSFQDTMLSLAQNFSSTGKINNVYFNEGEKEVFQNTIARMELKNDQIVFIFKQ